MEKRMKPFVAIRITSWIGTLGYARHYYCRLRIIYGDSKDEMEIKKVLTKEDIENDKYKDYENYSIGDKTSRFANFMGMADEIKKTFRENYLNKGYYLVIEELKHFGNTDINYWLKFFTGIPIVYIPYNWGLKGDGYKFVENK